MFRPKRQEVKGGWQQLHSEIHNFYYSQNTIKAMNNVQDDTGIKN